MADPAPRPGLIDSFMGLFKSEQPSPPPRDLGIKQEVKYPGEEEMTLGREVDQFYGNPKQAWFEPGVDIRKVDLRNAPEVVNDKRFDKVKWETLDQGLADKLYVAAVAANKSPLAGLGFDPRTFITSKEGTGKELSAVGAYMSKPDATWVNEKYPDTFVHESVHRGVELLMKAGALASTPEEAKTSGKMFVTSREEELITRAIMLRHFGDVEKTGHKLNDAQVEEARRTFSNPKNIAVIDKLEAMAADLIQKNTPMGPR